MMEMISLESSENPLGFSLELFGGRGILCAKQEQLGLVDLKLMELEIPELESPFDLPARPDFFKSHRCSLRHLSLGLSSFALSKGLKASDLRSQGFSDLKISFNKGFVELAGTILFQGRPADFTARASLSLRDSQLLNIIFYDIRVYGALGLPACLIPLYLRQALGLPYIKSPTCAAWELRPIQEFLRSVLPRAGWKIPEHQSASLVSAGINNEHLMLVCGDQPFSEPSTWGVSDVSLKSAYAAEAMGIFRETEQLLANGYFTEAFEAYWAVLNGEYAGAWVKNRLLQIGSALVERQPETIELAKRCLAEDPSCAPALLALGNIAQINKDYEQAAKYYSLLSRDAQKSGNRFEQIHAELAAGAASEHLDIQQAIIYYESAAAQDKNSISAYRGIFRLRRELQDWTGAKRAGERLVGLDLHPQVKAEVLCQLASINSEHFEDYELARQGFEKALREQEDYEPALEGLAATFIARGEPARALVFLTRLFEKARLEQQVSRVTEIGLQLAGLWAHELKDISTAIEHYQLVVAVDRKNTQARIQLAKLYLSQNQNRQAILLLEDLIRVAEDDNRTDAVEDFVEANFMLVSLIESADEPHWGLIDCFERIIDKDPLNQRALTQIAPLLRESESWTRLAPVLDALGELAIEDDARLAYWSECAQLYKTKLNSSAQAVGIYSKILEQVPLHSLALDEMRNLARTYTERQILSVHVAEAARLEENTSRQAELYFELGSVLLALDTPPNQVADAFVRALDIAPKMVTAARSLCALYQRITDPSGHCDALLRLVKASADSGEQALALCERGKLLWTKLEQPDAAAQALREALELNPELRDGWLLLADLLDKTGMVEAAIGVLESSLEHLQGHSKDSIAVYERLAYLARKINSMESECEYLEHCIRLGGTEDSLCERLLDVLSRMERFEAAAEYMEAWARQGDILESSQMALNAIRLFHSLGESSRAVSFSKELIEQGYNQPEEFDYSSDNVTCALAAAKLLEAICRDTADKHGVVTAIRAALSFSPDQLMETLERLLVAEVDDDNKEGAFESATKLLECNFESRLAHSFLAQYQTEAGEYLQALSHWENFFKSSEPIRPIHISISHANKEAFGLACEVAPEMVETLYELSISDSQSAKESWVDSGILPLGDSLLEERKYQQFAHLRAWQIDKKLPGDISARQWDLALTYHRHLGQFDEAISLYKEIICSEDASNQTVQDAFNALIELLRETQQWSELCSVLVRLSGRLPDAKESLELGLEVVDILVDKLDDRIAAQASLAKLVADYTDSYSVATILEAFRKYGFHGELATLLEVNLEADWSTEDGRFNELLRLYNAYLNRPEAAIRLLRKAIEKTPSFDLAWWQLLCFYEENSSLGSALETLEAWIEHSEGNKKLFLMKELYSRLEVEELEQDSTGLVSKQITLLREIAIADSTPVGALDKLANLHQACGDVANTIKVLEEMVSALEPGPKQDEVLMRLLEFGDAHKEKPLWRRRVLEQLSNKAPKHWRELGALFYRDQNYRELLDWPQCTPYLEASECIVLANYWLDNCELDFSRLYFEQFLAHGGDSILVWPIVTRAWLSAKRERELGRWKLEAAKYNAEPEAAKLRVEGACEVLDALASESTDSLTLDQFKGQLVEQFNIESDFAELGLAELGETWSILRLARFIDAEIWVERSARVLEAQGAESDSYYGEVLVVLHGIEMSLHNYDAALELAKRLVGLGHSLGGELWESALEGAGYWNELIELLERRAKENEASADEVWLRIAGICAEQSDWNKAAAALDAVAETMRGLTWAQLAYEVGECVSDYRLQAQGACIFCRNSKDPTESAIWLRRWGRIAWWHLGQVELAAELLLEANQLEPEPILLFLTRSEKSLEHKEVEEALQWLCEGILLNPEASGMPLRVALVDLLLAEHRIDDARLQFEKYCRLISKESADWVWTLAVASQVGDSEFEVRALTHLYEGNRDFFEPLVEALEENENWSTLVTTLVERAEEFSDDLDSASSAECLDKAGTISREFLNDSIRALNYWLEAARIYPDEERLFKALELALAVNSSTNAATLAEMILEFLPENSPERTDVLRVLLQARDSLSLESEGKVILRELYERGEATHEEQERLADKLDENESSLAAIIYEELATVWSTSNSQADHWFKAAKKFYSVGDIPRAKTALTNAFENEVEIPQAFALGLELFEGEQRGAAIEGFLSYEGDSDWELSKRLDMRFELAELYLNAGSLESIWEVVRDLESLDKNEQTIALKEKLLHKQGNEQELALLWLEEGLSGRAGWGGTELAERLLGAVAYFAGVEHLEFEFRALEGLVEFIDAEDEAFQRLIELCAELNKRDDFHRYVVQSLDSVGDSEQGESWVVRYSNWYAGAFNEIDTAIELLEEQFQKCPSLVLAKELEGHYTKLNRRPDSYRIYQELLSEHKEYEAARAFCLEYSSQSKLWSDWLQFAELNLEFIENSELRHQWLVEMARCQRDEFQDDEAAIELLIRALHWKQAPLETSECLYELVLARGAYTLALKLLEEDYFSAAHTEKYGLKLLDVLQGEESKTQRQQLLQWLVARYPKSRASLDFALENARLDGEGNTLLEALRNKLELDDSLSENTRVSLISEAAWAALDCGEDKTALDFLLALVQGDEPSPDILFATFLCARRLDNNEALAKLLEVSHCHIEAVEMWAPNVLAQEQEAATEFIAAIWAKAGDVSRSINARLTVLGELEPEVQKAVLEECLLLIGQGCDSGLLEQKNAVLAQLIELCEENGDAQSLLVYRCEQVSSLSGEFGELVHVYALACELENREIQARLIARGAQRIDEVAEFLSSGPVEDGGFALGFVRSIYEHVGEFESVVKIIMSGWEAQPPLDMKKAIDECLQLLEQGDKPVDPTLVMDLHHRMIVVAQGLDKPELELKHSLQIVQKGHKEPEFALRVYSLALTIGDEQSLKNIIGEFSSSAPVFEKWATSLTNSEVKHKAYELLYELYRNSGQLSNAIEARLLLVEILPLDEARALIDECLKDCEALNQEPLATLHARLLYCEGFLAKELGDRAGAFSSWEKARDFTPDDLSIIASLRELYEEDEKWNEVESLRLQELSAAPNLEVQYTQLKALANLYETSLDAPHKAIEMLEQAVACRLDDDASLEVLVNYYESNKIWDKFLARFEQLLPYLDEQEISLERMENIARAYDEIGTEPEKSLLYYRRVLESRPADLQVISIACRLAKSVGDFELFASMELALLEHEDNLKHRITRTFQLIEVLRDRVGDSEKSDVLIHKARGLAHSHGPVLRQLADEYAGDQNSYVLARDMYVTLHEITPFDTHILRILARLCGQLGDSERAYGFYAGLLALEAQDEEASRYVAACRQIRPRLPRRSIQDEDRSLLFSADCPEVIEDFYGPLARYVEGLEPASLQRRGVSERDRMQPTNPQTQLLIQVLEPLGVEQSNLFHWRGGGFECDTELIGVPTFLVGSNVLTGASQREQMFLVARTAELYRAGHTFCSRLSPKELQELLSALATSIEPSLSVSGDPDAIRRLSTRIENQFTPALKKSFTGKARDYTSEIGYSDIIAWKEASLANACRTALLLTCDLAEAVETLLRLHDRDVDSYEDRIEAMGEIPELFDLVRFGTSEAYFQLRARLGVELAA